MYSLPWQEISSQGTCGFTVMEMSPQPETETAMSAGKRSSSSLAMDSFLIRGMSQKRREKLPIDRQRTWSGRLLGGVIVSSTSLRTW